MPTNFPNVPSVISVSDLTVGGTLTVQGNANFRQIYFENTLITKLYLWSTTFGIGISSGQMNFFVPSTNSMVFYSGGDNNTGTEVLRINSSGLTLPGKITVAGQTMYPQVVPPTIPNIAGYTTYYLFSPVDAKRVTLVFHNIGTTVGTFPVRFTADSNQSGLWDPWSFSTANTQGLSSTNYNASFLNIWSGTGWGTAIRMSGCIIFQFMANIDANNMTYSVTGSSARTDTGGVQGFTYAGAITGNAFNINRPTRWGITAPSNNFTANSYFSIIYE